MGRKRKRKVKLNNGRKWSKSYVAQFNPLLKEDREKMYRLGIPVFKKYRDIDK